MLKKLIKMIGYVAVILMISVIWLAFGNIVLKTNDFTVGVVGSTTYAKKAGQWNRVKKVVLYHDERQIFKELEAGNLEAGVTDHLVGLYVIAKNGYHHLKPAGRILDLETIVTAFHREDKALRQAFNQGLNEIIDNGIYAKISHKYFGTNILEGVEYHPTYPDELPATDNSWNRVKREGRIVFTMIGNYPPFVYFNENSQLAGFDVDLARAVCERMGLQFVPVTIEWDQAQQGLKGKNYDGTWGSLLPADKSGLVEYSNPCYLTGVQLFVREGSPVTGPEILVDSFKVPILFPLQIKSCVLFNKLPISIYNR
jgi:ABC-type amino acid transport substrate-binding protein